MNYLTSICRIFSRIASPTSNVKMVRYFPNNFEDYNPGLSSDCNAAEIKGHVTEYLNNITKKFRPTPKAVDGGLYVGVTGVAYMFYHLSKNPALLDDKQNYLTMAVEYLKPALENSIGDETSFLLGNAGTYAVAAALFKSLGNENSEKYLKHYKILYDRYLERNFLKCGGDEFFVGRSGYLAGALWLNRELSTVVFTDNELYRICDIIVESGRHYSNKRKSRCPLLYHYYNVEYLGAAHGISFILQMLLSVPGYLAHNPAAARDIEGSTHFICNLQTPDGNWPCTMEEVGLDDHKLIHWCHGAPGTIYLMAKAYLVFKDPKFLAAAVKAGEEIWRKGLLRKGPGICHGVAGNGYAFLLLYRLTEDKKYLYRAKMFANFMNTEEFLLEAKVPDNPETLYEGTAGTVCYLVDLLTPDMAEFPFQDVFSA